MKKNKAFNTLLIGQTIADIGDTIYTVAIISSIFNLTKSALAASLVPVIINGGMFLSGLLVPIVINKLNLTTILKFSQFFKTILLLILAIYLQFNLANINLYFLYLLIAGISFLDGCSYPVSKALIPHYVAKSDLIKANSIFNSVNQMVNIGSWAIGSTLLIILSITNLIWFDVATFILSTLFLWWLPAIKNVQNTPKSTLDSFLLGWKEIKNNKLSRTIVIMDILETIANATWVSSIVLVFVKEVLQVSENWWGYINATFFIGTLMGSIIVIRLSDWVDRNKGTAIFYGSLLGAITTALVAPGWNPLFILICSIFVGIFSQIKNIPQATVIQKKVAHEKLASFYASTSVLYTGAFSIAIILMGYIADHINVNLVFIISALLLFVVSVMAKINKDLLD